MFINIFDYSAGNSDQGGYYTISGLLLKAIRVTPNFHRL
jgi:hypothetical protein